MVGWGRGQKNYSRNGLNLREKWSNHFFWHHDAPFIRRWGDQKKKFSHKLSEMGKKLVKSLFSRIKAQSRGPFWGDLFLFFLLFNLRWAQLYVSLVLWIIHFQRGRDGYLEMQIRPSAKMEHSQILQSAPRCLSLNFPDCKIQRRNSNLVVAYLPNCCIHKLQEWEMHFQGGWEIQLRPLLSTGWGDWA